MISNENSLNRASKNKLAKQANNIHKFGGSSLASAQCIERVINLISNHCQLNDIVVVSANGKTTDQLFALHALGLSLFSSKKTTQSKDSNEESNTLLSEKISLALALIEQQQIALISDLLSEAASEKLIETLTTDIAQLAKWLADDPIAYCNDILAYGELWSAGLLAALLNEKICPSYSIDARDFLVLDNNENLAIDYSLSRAQLKQQLQKNKLAVVTGYISKDKQGQTCTLGRNGSDYSATIIAALIGAKNATLWTDVDGIYSADPRVVPNARKLHRLPNGVARELGRLGNPVLHAKTLNPLTSPEATIDNLSYHCHLHVASSFDASVIGTEIGKFGQIAKQWREQNSGKK